MATTSSNWHNSVPPAVQAHQFSVSADAAAYAGDFIKSSKDHERASQAFLQAAKHISDSKTSFALRLLADSHAQRAREDSLLQSKTTTSSASESKDEEHQKPSSIDWTSNTSSGESNNPPPSSVSSSSDNTTIAAAAALDDSINTSDATKDIEDKVLNAQDDMEELWSQLNRIGLSRTSVSMSSSLRRLSSSNGAMLHQNKAALLATNSALGDSFCLLPTRTTADKNTSKIGSVTPVDGGATLRAAAASRLRNQRSRLISQAKAPPPPTSPASSSNPELKAAASQMNENHFQGARTSSPSVITSQEYERLSSLNRHQKHEIVRLLQAVSTLGKENSKLLKESEDKASLEEQNRNLRESMNAFKEQYNIKFAAMKGALEEWRRQKELRDSNDLVQQVEDLKSTVSQLNGEIKIKNSQLAKYDQWYKTIKAKASK